MSKFADILKSDIKYEILLPEYYKRDVKCKFINPAGEKGYKRFTVFMISNLNGWFDERLSCIKFKMEEAGYKEITFKNLTDYIKMTNEEVDHHLKFGDMILSFNDLIDENFNVPEFISKPITQMGFSLLSSILK